MMTSISIAKGVGIAAAVGVVVLVLVSASPRGGVSAQEGSAEKAVSVPVEDDMHEFMEYVFLPTYERLKSQMAAEPGGQQAWKDIRSASLILAEGGNLLLLRPSEEDAGEWKQLSLAVREHGAKLYQSARKRDYPAARGHYEAMLTRCNACHERFAGGEYQLSP
jgi:hypothetical protein